MSEGRGGREGGRGRGGRMKEEEGERVGVNTSTP